MRSISDEELDKVFREANEKVTYPFDPDAWAKMNSRLDKPGYWDRIKGLWPFGVLLLLLPAGLVIWNLADPSTGQSKSASRLVGGEAITNQLTDALATEQPEETSTHKAVVYHSKKEAVKDLTDPRVDLKSQVEPVRPAAHDSKRLVGSNLALKLPVPGIVSPTAVTGGTNSVGQQRVTPGYMGTDSEVSKDIQGQSPEPDGTSDGISSQSVRQSNESMSDTSGFSNHGVINQDLAATVEDSLQIDQTIESQGKWGLRLQLSPDFTSVAGSGPDKPGINIGLTVDYQIGNHLILSTGAIYTRKKYTGYDLEYEYNSRKYTADELLGDCRMLDIPINLYYRVHTKGSLRLFVGAGVSSYILFSEEYTYYVNTGYGQRVINQSVENENRSLFSQLNLSVGLEKELKPNLAFQIEPFLKAPLSGVGEGQVGLASYGAFFTMKYYFKK